MDFFPTRFYGLSGNTNYYIYYFQSKRDHFAYFPSQPKEEIGMMALRYKNFKAHFYTKGRYQ